MVVVGNPTKKREEAKDVMGKVGAQKEKVKDDVLTHATWSVVEKERLGSDGLSHREGQMLEIWRFA